MERPTTRPATKHKPMDIIKMSTKHFVEDGAPKCRSPYGGCVYGSTGCFVGFMLTEEDAQTLDEGGCTVTETCQVDCGLLAIQQEVLAHYFDVKDDLTLFVLIQGQRVHDVCPPEEFSSRMSTWLASVKLTLENVALCRG